MNRVSPALFAAVLALWLTGCATPLRIIVAGDGRAESKPRPEDTNGLNMVINPEICRAVLREKAQALLWTGDLMNLTNRDAALFESELRTWRSVYQPLYDRGLAVLPTRGNHELACPTSAEVWDKVFSGPYALPDNGPAAQKNLTFFKQIGPVLCIGVDQYQSGREMIDQTWLDQTLRDHPAPFIFVYGHEPAFMDGLHKDTLDAHPDMRDAVWESLIRAGSRVYFCGHDHFYDHMKVTRAQGEAGPEMHQFTAGTAGAPFYHGGPYAGNNTYWRLTQVKHIDHTYGYIVIEIRGRTATITFKGRVAPNRYRVMDRFSYSVGQP
ncbi:MAG TPA: metallophosphoesterase [Verrucomicrobiae bacterium]|jgi:hypothetical protein|nr:metallophosphoesterase [Verrucomicrobiae bacterium]